MIKLADTDFTDLEFSAVVHTQRRSEYAARFLLGGVEIEVWLSRYTQNQKTYWFQSVAVLSAKDKHKHLYTYSGNDDKFPIRELALAAAHHSIESLPLAINRALDCYKQTRPKSAQWLDPEHESLALQLEEVLGRWEGLNDAS